eukprot:TRINITY_DN25964_c0_g1_i2.p2 TRINITY_DN25964_c0_g1~~TRINITY_DN25964_c0_g1_i2.p2  ORF type:complete len:183 (-),score=48.35 TRINITY_DN25964_c0_g1_i2:93-641(-)
MCIRDRYQRRVHGRDNYLTKVASISKIGKTVLFQGATAKNQALIAAFEQKLQKPIHVSRFCHLTGALGVALTLKDQKIAEKKFRGFDLWKTPIPVRQETCKLCMNHCKLTIADINHELVAFGFLCGRDYNDKGYVAKAEHFHLIKARKKSVSYTHLTLPTILLVQISVVAVSLKKKNNTQVV